MMNRQVAVVAFLLMGAINGQNNIVSKETETRMIQDEDDFPFLEQAENGTLETSGKPNIYKIKDGFIIDYKNGTTIKKSKIENASTSVRSGTPPVNGGWFDKKFRKMIEDVIGQVINDKLVPKYENILKEMKQIKEEEKIINATLGAIGKSQDQLNRTLANERIIERNDTKNIQTKLEDIEKSGIFFRNRLKRAIVDVNDNLTKQINAIVKHNNTGNNTDIMKSLNEEVQKVKNAFENAIGNKISKQIEELKLVQVTATNKKINDTIKLDKIRKLLTKEIYAIHNFTMDLKDEMNKIKKMSNKTNIDIRDMKENLTRGIKEVKQKHYLNSKHVVDLLKSEGNRSKHDIENVIRLTLNTTNNDIKNTQNQLSNEFRNLEKLQKRLNNGTLNAINDSRRDILQNLIDMKETFTNSTNNQTGILELLTKYNVQINETLMNASLELDQNLNLTGNVLKNYIQEKANGVIKNQNIIANQIEKHMDKSEDRTRKELSLTLMKTIEDIHSIAENTTNYVVTEFNDKLNKTTNNPLIEADLLKKLANDLDDIKARLQESPYSSDKNINRLKEEILQTLDHQNGVLKKKLENIRNNQNIAKKEIVRKLSNTRKILKNLLSVTYSALTEKITNNSKQIGDKIDSIKELELEIIEMRKNIEGNVTDGGLGSKIRKVMSKLLNKTAKILLNDSKKNTREVKLEIKKEMEKIQESLNNVRKKLSTKINKLKNQTRSDLVNETTKILVSLGDVRKKLKTMKRDLLNGSRNTEGGLKKLSEELDKQARHFESKIESNLLNIPIILSNTEELKEGIRDNIQVENQLWQDFNKTKKYIKKAITGFRRNGNLTQTKLDLESQQLKNVGNVLLKSISKSKADLLTNTNSANKKLKKQINLGTRKNQESKTAILERIKFLEKILQKAINKSSVDAVDYDRIEKAVYETKQNLTTIINENRKNLSVQIKESPNETNKFIHDSKSLLLGKLESLEKNAVKHIKSKGKQVLDALQNVKENLKNETNQNRKEIDSTKTDIIAGLQIIYGKQNKLNRTIKQYAAVLLNRLKNTNKYIINTHKIVLGEINNMRNSFDTFANKSGRELEDFNFNRLLEKIEETKDVMDKTKRDIESEIKNKSVQIIKGITDISASQAELETKIDKGDHGLSSAMTDTKNNVNFGNKQIRKVLNKLDHVHSHSKSIENQQKEIIQALKTTDTKKYIADLGRNISQDMEDFKKYFKESNANIIINVHSLANKINNSTGAIIQELKDPKKTAVILELIKRATGLLLNKLINLEKYEDDTRKTLTNQTEDVIQAIDRTREDVLNSINSGESELNGTILNVRAKIEKGIQDSNDKADTNNGHIVKGLGNIKQNQYRIKNSLDALNAYLRNRHRQQANHTAIVQDINRRRLEIVGKIDDTKRDLINATDHLTEKIKSMEDTMICTSCDEVKDNNETVKNQTAEVFFTAQENNDDFDKINKDKKHTREFRNGAPKKFGNEDNDKSDIKDISPDDNWYNLEKNKTVFDINEKAGDNLDTETKKGEKDNIKAKILEALRKTYIN